MVASE
jgi:hypothetical protein